MIRLSIACGIAVNRKANTIAAGMHSGDHFIYPDCRPKFIFSVGMAMLQGNEGFHNFDLSDDVVIDGKSFYSAKPITTPFLDKTKADIAYRALELGVPLHMTWSCYKGGENHCGRCGTCVERLEAVHEALMRRANDIHGWKEVDLTVYDDTEFWKTQIKKAEQS
jgi:7-cyano-7-deazaguanine synthase